MPPESPAAAPLEGLEAVLGARFADRALLRSAVTHRSFLNEAEGDGAEDNERLEFLGDAFLDLVTAEHLYRTLPEAREGTLTTLRSQLVCRPTLARFAAAIDLGRYLRLGRGEASGGGRARPTVMGNAFEALIGALLLDQGPAVTRTVVLRFVEPELAALLSAHELQDAKSRFQEQAQRLWQLTPRYTTVGEEGPGHDRTFVVQVAVGAEPWGTGRGPSKAVAARRAAAEALDRLAAELAAGELAGDPA
jgi:ribonuclease-3